MYMAEMLTALKRDARNQSPIERPLENVLSHSPVSFALLPLPKSETPRKRDGAFPRDRSGSPPVWNKSRRASKGKSKGKKSGKGPTVPEGLIVKPRMENALVGLTTSMDVPKLSKDRREREACACAQSQDALNFAACADASGQSQVSCRKRRCLFVERESAR